MGGHDPPTFNGGDAPGAMYVNLNSGASKNRAAAELLRSGPSGPLKILHRLQMQCFKWAGSQF